MNIKWLNSKTLDSAFTKMGFITNVYTLLPIVIFALLLPHLLSAPLFVAFYVVLLLAWFSIHSLGFIRLPKRVIRLLLILSAIIIISTSYGFHFSQQAALSLLSIMISLKFLEVKNDQDKRNIFIIIYLGCFILITYFFHSQSLLLALFASVMSFILVLMLSAFSRKPQEPIPLVAHIKIIIQLFSKALPIAIILFLFFPRIPGPLWSLPDDNQMGKTGLSDKMYPGSVSNLVDSDEIAFRVDFKGKPPTADKLYWRGPVLSKTDGFLWTQENPRALHKPFNAIVTKTRDAISYTITLEPHQQKWLFALEMPSKIEGDTIQGFFISNDLQVINKHNIHQLTQYRVTSMTEFYLNPVRENELHNALYFPPSSNPKTYALGEQWRKQFNNKQDIVLAGLNYFKNQPFYYTKQPSIMENNPSDEFLFNYKRGFCEHYASSFVLLMRAANIPARVVTGYQGLEKNSIGNYYLVRQANAHAWAEVWLEHKGWFRVDPTAMIPPERIEADIFQTYLEGLSFSSLNLPELSAQQKTKIYRAYQKVKQSIDSMKHAWNNWVLGYDKTKQGLLLKLMGLNDSLQTLMLLLITSISGLLIIFQANNLYKQYKEKDRVYETYLLFIKKLNKKGLLISSAKGINNEGPEAIKIRAIKKFPNDALLIQTIVNHYIQIRYADNSAKSLKAEFINKVNSFK